MDAIRTIALPLPLLIALVGCDFIGRDAPVPGAASDASDASDAIVAPVRRAAADAKPNSAMRSTSWRETNTNAHARGTIDARSAETRRRALNTAAVLGFGLTSLSMASR